MSSLSRSMRKRQARTRRQRIENFKKAHPEAHTLEELFLRQRWDFADIRNETWTLGNGRFPMRRG